MQLLFELKKIIIPSFFNPFKKSMMFKNLNRVVFATTTNLLLFASPSIKAQTWEVKSSMPTARWSPGAAVFKEKIYLFGGVLPDGSVTNVSEIYTTTVDSWDSCADMPTPRTEMATHTVGNKIYVIGGFNYSSSALDIVEIYDPATNSWDTGAPMPTPRSQISSCVIDNKIYITGGWPSEYDLLEIYDPETDTWETKSPIPVGVLQNNSGTACEGNFYVIGGKNYSGSAFYNTNFKYDPSLDEWTEKEPLPEELFSGAAATLDNKIHYFGGSRTNFAYSDNYDVHYIYDPATDSWTEGIPMTQKRASHVGLTVGNAIYAIGGIQTSGEESIVTGLTEKYSVGNTSTESAANIPKDILIYPNPASIELNIESKDPNNSIKQVSLIDICGRSILQEYFMKDKLTINISQLPPGIYYLNLKYTDATDTFKKIVIK